VHNQAMCAYDTRTRPRMPCHLRAAAGQLAAATERHRQFSTRIHSTLWSACQQESASHKHTCEESNRWTPRSNHWIRSNRWSQANHWRNLSQQRMQDRQGWGKTNRWTCPRIQSLDPPILQPLQSLETPATSESAKTPITGVCTQKHQSQVYAAANHRQLPRRAVSRHAQVHAQIQIKQSRSMNVHVCNCAWSQGRLGSGCALITITSIPIPASYPQWVWHPMLTRPEPHRPWAAQDALSSQPNVNC
jgi:hypothetical protein